MWVCKLIFGNFCHLLVQQFVGSAVVGGGGPGASHGIICPHCTQETLATIVQCVRSMTSCLLAAVGKNGNVFFLNENASKICSSWDCLQFSCPALQTPSWLWTVEGDSSPCTGAWSDQKRGAARCGADREEFLPERCLWCLSTPRRDHSRLTVSATPPGEARGPPCVWVWDSLLGRICTPLLGNRYNRHRSLPVLSCSPCSSCWFKLTFHVGWTEPARLGGVPGQVPVSSPVTARAHLPAGPVRDQVTADTTAYSRWRPSSQRAQR